MILPFLLSQLNFWGSHMVQNSLGCLQPCLSSVKKKSKLYKVFFKSPTPQNRLIFNKYRNKFKTLKTEAIRRYYAARFASCANDLKKTWKIIKQLLNSKGDTGPPDT